MKQIKLYIHILITLTLLFPCCFSASLINTEINSINNQKEENANIISSPKLSSYDITEQWNYTSYFDVTSVAVSADGRYVAVGVYDFIPRDVDPSHTLFFFNTSDHDGIPMWSFNLNSDISSLAISADGSYIAAISKDDDMAFLFDSEVPDPGLDKEPIWYVDWGYDLNSVDISADGELIVIGGDSDTSGMICLYNNSYASIDYDKTNEYIWYCNPEYTVNTVAISADGNYVVAGTEYGMIRDVDPLHQVFLFDNREEIDEYRLLLPIWSYAADDSIDSIAISADGSYIIAGSSVEYFACLFNSTIPGVTEEKLPIWEVGWDLFINSVDISADGKNIVVAGENVIVVLNNSYAQYNKENEYLWYYETAGDVYSVAISADGRYIIAGAEIFYRDISPYDTVFLFNNTDYDLADLHYPEWSFDTGGDVYSVSMSAWGNYFAAGGYYGSYGRTYLFYHARPLPYIPSSNGGDDDDDDGGEAIPFGNYYLLFIAISLISLVIITKRKIFFSKN